MINVNNLINNYKHIMYIYIIYIQNPYLKNLINTYAPKQQHIINKFE